MADDIRVRVSAAGSIRHEQLQHQQFRHAGYPGDNIHANPT